MLFLPLFYIFLRILFSLEKFFYIHIEKVQKKPSQNVPYWHVDYFELNSFKTQKTQE